MSASLFGLDDVRFHHILHLDHVEIRDPVTAIVGRSGSGKSSLLRLLNKLASPTSGRVLFRGTDLADVDSVAHRRRVALLSQSPIMFPGTAGDNANFARRLQRRDDAPDDDVSALFERLSLALKPGDRVDTLSGGERQRLALVRLLLADPEVYLLDEPSSALDRGSADEVMRLLAELAHEKGRHVVMVTHDPRVAGDLPQIRLDGGRVQTEEP